MTRGLRLSPGLVGRILIVLLLTVAFEFGASTLLYERATSLSWREDEARRLAEHLVIARKLLAERPPAQRAPIARELTTDRYDVSWLPAMPAPDPLPASSELVEIQRKILAWEPELESTQLRLTPARFGNRSTITGALRLPDRSWMYFAARGDRGHLDLEVGRMLLALIPAVALMIAGSLLIRRMLRPLQHLAGATQRIGTSDPVLMPEEGTLEVRRLIHAFNAMQERIHNLVADRIQALAAVGHDIRTPLSRIRLRLDGIDDGPVRRELESDVLEIEAMVASLLAFIGGEDEPEAPSATDLAVLAATVVDSAADQGGSATYRGPRHLEMRLRPVAIRRALTNLVENALHYGERARVSVLEEADRVIVRVDDDGPGVPPDEIDHVTEPFVRLDPARRRNTTGLGLGLAIVANAIRDEGGTFRLTNRGGGGLRAEIVLPRG